MKFDIRITETLEKTVTVEAEDIWEACHIVEEDWNEGKYVLDSSDFTGAEFTFAL